MWGLGIRHLGIRGVNIENHSVCEVDTCVIINVPT